jgi:hypothetical protein
MNEFTGFRLSEDEEEYVSRLMDNGGAFVSSEPWDLLDYENMLSNVQYAGVKAGGRALSKKEIERLVYAMFIDFHGANSHEAGFVKRPQGWSHV